MNQRSKQGLIICTVIVVLVTAVTLCVFPWFSVLSHSLEAVKLDAHGNEVGTVTISLKRVKTQSLFKTRPIKVSLEPFDGHEAFTVNFNNSYVRSSPNGNYFEVTFNHVYISPTSGIGGCSGTISVCEDFDLWLIRIRSDGGEEAYYVACANGNYTTEEILKYFDRSFLYLSMHPRRPLP